MRLLLRGHSEFSTPNSRFARHGVGMFLCVAILSQSRIPIAFATGDIPVGGIELKIQPPLPIWPSDYETITERRPAFRINGRFTATKYRVELAKDERFTNPVTFTDSKVVDLENIEPVVLVSYTGEPLADGQYYWRAFCGDDSGFWTPAANYRFFSVSETDRDAVVPPGELKHPYLLISSSEVQAIREKISRSEHLRRGWQYQVNAAHSALELEPVTEAYAKGGVGQHGNYSTCAGWYHRHMENVAFVGMITGDERLNRKGVEMLMTACSYEQWIGPPFLDPKSFDPPWRATLETAMMTEAVAIGYDLLYPHLTEQQRQTVRQALADKGIRMLVQEWADPIGSSRLPRHQVPTGNWVMVCSASGGLGALAILGEHPEAPQWTRLVRNRVRAWLHDRGGDWYADNPYPVNRPKPIPVIGPSDPNFGFDGGYKESIGYMNYGTRYVCFFGDALRRTTSESLFPHIPDNLLDHMAWSIMAWEKDGEVKSAVVDFGDEGGSVSWHGDLLACLMKNRGDRLAAWLYRSTAPMANTPRSLLWSDDHLKPEPPTRDGMRVFHGIGQVVMRDGWGPDDPMAAIKFRQNRGHLDIGTFFLFVGGKPAIIDSGSADYNSPIYGNYLAKTVAHNIVMVDNENQARADGQMLGAVSAGLISGVSGQLKAAYPDKLKSWTRDLVFIADGLAVVYDRLEGKGEHRFDLVLHPANPFEMTGPDELVIRTGLGKTRVAVFGGSPLKTVIEDGYHRTLPCRFVRFNAETPAIGARFITWCRWPTRPTEPAPETQTATEPSTAPQTRPWDRSGLTTRPPVLNPRTNWKLTRSEESPGFATVVDGMPGPMDNLTAESDARLAVVSKCVRSGGTLHAAMLAGMRLSVDDHELIRASRPVDLAIQLGDEICAQVSTASVVRLTVCLPKTVDDVYAEGVRLKVARDGNIVSFDAPAGESRLRFGSTGVRHPALASDLKPVVASEAQAFQENVRTRASSSWTDGVDALDGDVNTGWVSLPGLPMPQWLEVHLPRVESMTRMEINTGLPSAGRLESWDASANDWKLLGRFETTANKSTANIDFPATSADRLRAVIERIDPINKAATISEWRWSGPASQK